MRVLIGSLACLAALYFVAQARAQAPATPLKIELRLDEAQSLFQLGAQCVDKVAPSYACADFVGYWRNKLSGEFRRIEEEAKRPAAVAPKGEPKGEPK